MRLLEANKSDASPVSVAEALQLLEGVKDERRGSRNTAFGKTLEYLRSVPVLGGASWAERARKILVDADLTPYEAALVVNLGPERHADAKALVPSLGRFDNFTLDILLNELAEASLQCGA